MLTYLTEEKKNLFCFSGGAHTDQSIKTFDQEHLDPTTVLTGSEEAAARVCTLGNVLFVFREHVHFILATIFPDGCKLLSEGSFLPFNAAGRIYLAEVLI